MFNSWNGMHRKGSIYSTFKAQKSPHFFNGFHFCNLFRHVYGTHGQVPIFWSTSYPRVSQKIFLRLINRSSFLVCISRLSLLLKLLQKKKLINISSIIVDLRDNNGQTDSRMLNKKFYVVFTSEAFLFFRCFRFQKQHMYIS